ncbi:MAG: BCCT family transporter, partial [Pseudomonadota bacterium]
MSEANAPPPDADASADTDYEVGQDNIKIMGLDVHNPVFFVSAVVIVAFTIIALMFREDSEQFFSWLRPALTEFFDWSLLS